MYFNEEENQWQLNEYEHGELIGNIKQGIGKPQHLQIQKEIQEDGFFEEIYIKPKDFFFDHYEVRIQYNDCTNFYRETF